MAGVKGRSGGPRPNSGPKRRKVVISAVTDTESASKPLVLPASDATEPRDYLLSVMQNKEIDGRFRIDAAKALLPYMYPKMGEHGKKTERQSAAHKSSQGKFAPGAAPPRLAVVKN